MELAISRVLSWAIIHLGSMSPCRSSDLPGDSAGHTIVPLFGLAPGGVYHATQCYHWRGALLPHPFTLTGRLITTSLGGLLSAALSVGSRLPGITWHLALWSPDFPPHRLKRCSDSLANSERDNNTLMFANGVALHCSQTGLGCSIWIRGIRNRCRRVTCAPCAALLHRRAFSV